MATSSKKKNKKSVSKTASEKNKTNAALSGTAAALKKAEEETKAAAAAIKIKQEIDDYKNKTSNEYNTANNNSSMSADNTQTNEKGETSAVMISGSNSKIAVGSNDSTNYIDDTEIIISGNVLNKLNALNSLGDAYKLLAPAPDVVAHKKIVDDKGERVTDPEDYMEMISASKSNYYMNYQDDIKNFDSDLKKTDRTLGLDDRSSEATFRLLTTKYNRFKMATLNDQFTKGFAHVFFTRPDCNIMKTQTALQQSFASNTLYTHCFKQSPELVRQLSLSKNGSNHDFMMYLSNKAASFGLNDEYINTDTYGKSYGGWKIAYGKTDVESKTAGDFSVTYKDDRMLHVYQLHKMWMDYISGCYIGKYEPLSTYVENHILDYASSCYYIVTAEDGETIVFWSKYYGVFPSSVPSNQYSWAYGDVIKSPEVEIKYNYSFKEDYNPTALAEFNANSGMGDSTTKISYVPVYDPTLGHSGTTWVGAPFIETIKGSSSSDFPYTFKLRFKK